jgi:hypothetical protein
MAENKNTQKLPSEKEIKADLQDSPQDAEKLKSEKTTIDLPDVHDIPGQENYKVPEEHLLGDPTVASADEEGEGLFEENSGTDIRSDRDTDITREEREILMHADHPPTDDERRLHQAGLESTDDEGDLLNEGSMSTARSGSDLDLTGTDADDPMEKIGEEDEENNHYSLGSDSNDNATEGTP